MNLPVKQSILAIFAHPDDESFGPGGTLAMLAKSNQVHLVCVTDGNSYNTTDNLTQTRAKELKTAAKVLGLTSVHQLEYQDGHIANAVYHEISDKLILLIDRYQPTILITYEPHGVSGHLDHVGLSYITTYVFYKTSIPRQLWQYCISTKAAANRQDYFIYFPPGYDPTKVDLKVDITPVFNQKMSAIRAHKSQAHDATRHIEKLMSLPKEELFLVKNQIIMPKKSPETTNQATFAGGCFWCIEAAFLDFPGVTSVTSGYTGGTVKDPSYQQVSTGTTGHYETVRLNFDPKQTTYRQLIKHFFLQIDPTDQGGQFADQGSHYQTAIFYHNPTQRQEAQAYIKKLNQSGIYSLPIVTQVKKAAPFYPAEDYHQHYALKNPLRYQLYKHASGRK